MAKILSAGIVPVRRTATGWRLLILRAYRNWDFPKGRVEENEDISAAALRETMEETGLTHLKFAFGDIYRETTPYAGGKIARYYIAATDEERAGVKGHLGGRRHAERDTYPAALQRGQRRAERTPADRFDDDVVLGGCGNLVADRDLVGGRLVLTGFDGQVRALDPATGRTVG